MTADIADVIAPVSRPRPMCAHGGGGPRLTLPSGSPGFHAATPLEPPHDPAYHHARRLCGDRGNSPSSALKHSRAPSGDFYVWLKTEYVDRLRELRGPGESFSDVILRLAEASEGGSDGRRVQTLARSVDLEAGELISSDTAREAGSSAMLNRAADSSGCEHSDAPFSRLPPDASRRAAPRSD